MPSSVPWLSIIVPGTLVSSKKESSKSRFVLIVNGKPGVLISNL